MSNVLVGTASWADKSLVDSGRFYPPAAKSAEARLAQTLLQLATQVGEVQRSGVIIEITNEQLSSLSDISSFTASRLLSKWERHGAVHKERGRVTLVAPEALMVP